MNRIIVLFLAAMAMSFARQAASREVTQPPALPVSRHTPIVLVVRNPGATLRHDHIPEFRNALAACKNKINIYLDFKEADVGETWRQIRAAGMGHQVVVYLNKPEQYGQWRTIAPRMPLMSSLPDEVKTPGQIAAFLQQKQINVLDNVYDTTLQNFVRQKGVSLWLDGQSDHEGPATWKPLLAGHIQGIQTDHPEELIPWLRHRGTAAAPPATPLATPNPPATDPTTALPTSRKTKTGHAAFLAGSGGRVAHLIF